MKDSVLRKIVLGVSVLALSGALYAADSSESKITVASAVLQVLEQNPTVSASIQEYRSRGYEVREARAGYLPSIDVTLGTGYEETRYPSTNGNETNLYRKEAAINFRQMLFDGLGTQNEVRRQKAREEVALYEAYSVAENEALTAVEVFLNVLKAYQFRELAHDTLKVHDRIYSQMQSRSDSGVGSDADLNQISARVALAKGNVITAESNYRDAVTNYLRVIGTSPVLSQMVTPSPLPAELFVNSNDETEQALRNHPTLLAATADIKAAQAQYSASTSRMWPRVHFEASQTLDNDIGGVEGVDNDLIVAVRLRYDLYQGGANSARKKSMAYQLEEAKDLRDKTHRQVIEAMRLSYNAYEALGAHLEYLNQHVAYARDTRKAYQEQYRLGKRTLLDVLNAENEYVDASRALIKAQSDYQLSEYRILNARGELITTLGLSMQRVITEKGDL